MASDAGLPAVNGGLLMERAARGDRDAAQILRGVSLLRLSRRADEFPGVAAPGVGVRTAICVCTAMRPRLLRHCLESIGLQLVPKGADVDVVVVDNDADRNNYDLVKDFSTRCTFPVHYVHEPRSGVPQARNAALEKCRNIGADWIAFTNDDCWASPAWLACLLDAARRHRADIVCGRRDFLFPLPRPVWAMRAEDEAERFDCPSMHNVLLAAWLIGRAAQPGMAFDERLAHSEDTDFFYRAVRHGARVVYSAEPVVFETVSSERATLGYQTWRAYHDAARRSYFHRRYLGITRTGAKLGGRFLFQVPTALMRLTLAPLTWPFSQDAFRDLVTKGAARLAGAAGATAGLLGFCGNPYQSVKGY
jgi:succinoglycan biosynthesis protein ExoM